MAAVGSSVLDVYNPVFYAQEALVWLKNSLGIANTVHRGFEAERSRGLGDTISIRRPQTFSVENAPGTAVGLDTESVSITLDQWKEVKFALTDKELAYTGERIINEHIGPAAYALANNIDAALWDQYIYVGNRVAHNTAADKAVDNLTTVRKALFDAQVPMTAGDIYYGFDSTVEQDLLQDTVFSNFDGAGQIGVDTQVNGRLGRKFGLDLFAGQNVNAHTSGTTTDLAGAINGAAAKGATSLTLDALGTGTITAGDTLTIAGDTTSYAVTAAVTIAANAATVSISPPLQVAADDDAVVTLVSDDETGVGLAYHRNAFALVMAPLPELGNELGARVATVQDPDTGLALRSRVYYVGNSSQVHVALDCLYGVKTLDARLACRVEY
jgi:hypothetical protein